MQSCPMQLAKVSSMLVIYKVETDFVLLSKSFVPSITTPPFFIIPCPLAILPIFKPFSLGTRAVICGPLLPNEKWMKEANLSNSNVSFCE